MYAMPEGAHLNPEHLPAECMPLKEVVGCDDFMLSQIAQESGFSSVVQQWRGVLDPDLESSPKPVVDIEPPYDKPVIQQEGTQGPEAQVEADDEDLQGDIQRYRVSGQRDATKKSKQQPRPKAAGSRETDLLGLSTESQQLEAKGR